MGEMKADFPESDQAASRKGPASSLRVRAETATSTRDETPDNRFDEQLAEAVYVVLNDGPELLEPPPNSSLRLTRETFIEHLTRMVGQVDAHDNRKLPVPPLAEWCAIKPPTARAILGRHPLIPRVQPVRAALELRANQPDRALTVVIKVFAGIHDTTMVRRGVHRPKPSSKAGRQMHLALVAITGAGRAILVNTERFAVGDVTWDSMRAAGIDAVAASRSEGIVDAGLLRERWANAIAGYQLGNWGEHTTGRPPQTVAEHVGALVGEAIRGAILVGAADLYEQVPVLGGQLITATKTGMLPDEPIASMVSYDLAAVEQLCNLGLMPALNLDAVETTGWQPRSEIPFTVKLARADGEAAPHGGPELLALISDPNRATPVPREQLGLRSLMLAVNDVDGEIDLPSGPCAVRIFYRAGLVPHALYLVPMVPGDAKTHERAIKAIVLESTHLHTGPAALMTAVRDTCERKGAFDPGGERAAPTESLTTIAQLAADRELHRRSAA